MTIVTAVRDVAAASETYQGLMGGVEVPTAWSDGRRAFQVGDDTIVELVASNSPELGGFGDGVFGMAFHVAYLAAAEICLKELALPSRRGAHGSFFVYPELARKRFVWGTRWFVRVESGWTSIFKTEKEMTTY